MRTTGRGCGAGCDWRLVGGLAIPSSSSRTASGGLPSFVDTSVPPCWACHFASRGKVAAKTACPIIRVFAALRLPSFRCPPQARPEGPSVAHRGFLGVLPRLWHPVSLYLLPPASMRSSKPATQHLHSVFSRGVWVPSASSASSQLDRSHAPAWECSPSTLQRVQGRLPRRSVGAIGLKGLPACTD